MNTLVVIIILLTDMSTAVQELKMAECPTEQEILFMETRLSDEKHLVILGCYPDNSKGM